MQKIIFVLAFFFFFLQKNIGQSLTDTIPGTEVFFTMKLIPGGQFQMGSPEKDVSAQNPETYLRIVTLDSFWIGIHEVKYDEFILFYQREYDSDVSTNPAVKYSADAVSRPTPQYIDYTYGMGKNGFPAVSMTQQAALRYCQWLYQKTDHFYRLPTEAEWEYACLGGDVDYPMPDTELGDLAWYYENSFEKYHESGKKEPPGYGLYDMLGNVIEWTLDYYQEDYLKNLTDSSSQNPWIIPVRRHSRTVKGGSYDSDPEDCRCKARQKSSPRWQARDPQIPKSRWWNPDSPFVGFRIVRPVGKMTPSEVDAFFEKAIKD